MAGAPSHVDLFDEKPKLRELDGQALPESMTASVRFAFIRKESAVLMGSPFEFRSYGDCGMLTTADEEVATRLRSLRAHGAATKYFHDEVGMNSRLDALQAAILRVKLPHLDEWNDARAANAARYDALFAAAGAATSATPLSDGGLPLRSPEPPTPGARHVYNQYVIRVPAGKRDPLREHLNEAGIGNAVYYPKPLHRQTAYREFPTAGGPLRVSERLSDDVVSLPMHAYLDEPTQARIAETIQAAVT